MSLRLFLAFCFLLSIELQSEVQAGKPSFKSYELESKYGEMLFVDFDNDGLDDIIVIDEPNLIFFLQDPKEGFKKAPDLGYSLENKPSVIWYTKSEKHFGSNILVMTDMGVSVLSYAGRSVPPEKRKIISRKTIIPEKCTNAPILAFNLTVVTADEHPILLIPVENNLEVWKCNNEWQYAYSLQGAPVTRIWGAYKKEGYTQYQLLNMNIGDINNDGLDDLVLYEDYTGKARFNIYLQTKDGEFLLKPIQLNEKELNWRTWICLQDINKDGYVDVIKSTWLQESWFLSLADSGKVIVQVFLAGENGDISDEPQYLFRKNDWTPSLPVVDIDGDGFADLVLGFGQFDSREGIRKAMTAKKLNHTLRFHFYNGSGFGRNSDFETEIAVQLKERGPIFTSRAGRVEDRTNLEGDFNGDGSRDLLVMDEENKASVYFFLSRKKGFSKKADIQFHMKSTYFSICDLNHDKISDLIVSDDNIKVYLSKKDKQ